MVGLEFENSKNENKLIQIDKVKVLLRYWTSRFLIKQLNWRCEYDGKSNLIWWASLNSSMASNYAILSISQFPVIASKHGFSRIFSNSHSWHLRMQFLSISQFLVIVFKHAMLILVLSCIVITTPLLEVPKSPPLRAKFHCTYPFPCLIRGW